MGKFVFIIYIYAERIEPLINFPQYLYFSFITFKLHLIGNQTSSLKVKYLTNNICHCRYLSWSLFSRYKQIVVNTMWVHDLHDLSTLKIIFIL